MELYAREFGQGSPVLILHGLFGFSDNWQTIAKGLATTHTVIVPDQRNHGRSPHVPGHTYTDLAEDVRMFLEERWVFSTAVVGHSMGGKAAMQLALNPLLDKPQLDTLLRAVEAQVLASGGHSYVFGEGERLARPVIFAARRGLHNAADWSGWFGRIASNATPAPGQPTDAAALARLHNAREFIWPLYVALQEGQDAALRERLLPGVLAALKALP